MKVVLSVGFWSEYAKRLKTLTSKGCILLWAPESLASDVHRDVILGVYRTVAPCIPTEWLQCRLISVDVLISSIREAVRSRMSLCRWISIPPSEQLNACCTLFALPHGQVIDSPLDASHTLVQEHH